MAFDWVLRSVSQDRVVVDVTVAGQTRTGIVFEGIDTDSPAIARVQMTNRLRGYVQGMRQELLRTVKPTPAPAVIAIINTVQADEPE